MRARSSTRTLFLLAALILLTLYCQFLHYRVDSLQQAISHYDGAWESQHKIDASINKMIQKTYERLSALEQERGK